MNPICASCNGPMKPLFRLEFFCPNDCDRKPPEEIKVVVWKGHKYRYLELEKDFKYSDIPSWAVYAWLQHRTMDRIDINQIDKHEGICAGADIAWKFNKNNLENVFALGMSYILFSDILP